MSSGGGKQRVKNEKSGNSKESKDGHILKFMSPIDMKKKREIEEKLLADQARKREFSGEKVIF